MYFPNPGKTDVYYPTAAGIQHILMSSNEKRADSIASLLKEYMQEPMNGKKAENYTTNFAEFIKYHSTLYGSVFGHGKWKYYKLRYNLLYKR